MKIFSWPFASLGIVILAIALFAAPTRLEGPVLVSISPGHALSLLDSFALALLFIGSAWLHSGLWQHRQRLYDSIRRSPNVGSVAAFAAGLGLGLLLASAFSSFFGWWAMGAVFYGAIMITALIVTTRR